MYWDRFISPYIRTYLKVMDIATLIFSLLMIMGVVYQHGFNIGTREIAELHTLYHIVWVVFLVDILSHLLLNFLESKRSFASMRWILSVLLLLTLMNVIFRRPSEDGSAAQWVWDFFRCDGYRVTLLLILSVFNLSSWFVGLLGRRTNPSLILALSFIVCIIVGTGLLMLPRCTTHAISWIDSLFVATSAVCVTGLSTVDVASTFTPSGLGIIIILIQIGGLGVMTLTSFFALFFMGNASLYNQIAMRDMVGSDSLNSLLTTLLYILGFTLVIEGIGAFAIWTDIHDTLGMTLEEEIGFSVFHSISAFCNAGFSTLPGNLGNPALMTGHNPFYFYISFLVLFGGIGYPILVNFKEIIASDLRRLLKMIRTRRLRWKHYNHLISLNSKIVLIFTAVLLVVGTVSIACFEWNGAFARMSVSDKLTQSFFNAVCPRTAGFSSVDLARFSFHSLLIYMLYMWIGGCAQSTAGGIKVNTFAVLLLNLGAVLRGTSRVEVFGRELSSSSIRRANATVMVSIIIIFVFVFTISLMEPFLAVGDIFFECVSALGTVGSSLGITAQLGTVSKLLICVLMLIGRVGFITLMWGIIKPKREAKYRYPSGEIIIN